MNWGKLDIESAAETTVKNETANSASETIQKKNKLFDMDAFENSDEWKEERMLMISCGNGGGNMLKHNILSNACGNVENYITDTDFVALKTKDVDGADVVLFGPKECRGKGAGTHPEKAEKAALESEDTIREMVRGAGLVFVIAGEGGGTGTGCAPVVAKIAKEEGAIVVAIVTKPFGFEGKMVTQRAIDGINKLRQNVNAILVVDNQKVLSIGEANIPWIAQLRKIDDFVGGILSGFVGVTRDNSKMKLDFNDIQHVFTNCEGSMFIGAGESTYTPMSAENKGWDGGKKAMMEAVENAISSPLVDDINLKNAKGVIALYLTGEDVSMEAIDEAQKRVMEATGNYEGSNIIVGADSSEAMNGKIKVFFIFAGLENEAEIEEKNTAVKQRVDTFDKGERIVIDFPETNNIQQPAFSVPVSPINNDKVDDNVQTISPISGDDKTSKHITKSIHGNSINSEIWKTNKKQETPSIYGREEVASFLRTQCQ